MRGKFELFGHISPPACRQISNGSSPRRATFTKEIDGFYYRVTMRANHVSLAEGYVRFGRKLASSRVVTIRVIPEKGDTHAFTAEAVQQHEEVPDEADDQGHPGRRGRRGLTKPVIQQKSNLGAQTGYVLGPQASFTFNYMSIS